MPDFQFHALLRALRATKKVRQEDVAEAAGVVKQTVGNWESGASTPNVPQIAALSTYFDVSADYLVGLSEFPHGLAPDSWLVDLDEYESGRSGKVWAAKVPRRMRIVDFAELEKLRSTQGKKGKH